MTQVAQGKQFLLQSMHLEVQDSQKHDPNQAKQQKHLLFLLPAISEVHSFNGTIRQEIQISLLKYANGYQEIKVIAEQ
jgi:hypothetical protein